MKSALMNKEQRTYFMDLFKMYKKGAWIEMNWMELVDRAGGENRLLIWLIENGIRFVYVPYVFTDEEKVTVAKDYATLGMSKSRIIVSKVVKMVPN